jgi:hypothetical protein
VLLLNNVEIHLINTNLESAVVLCDEPSLSWNDPAYSAFVLPADGTLVRVSEGLGADSRVLTYRRAFITDALNYVTKLMQAGWSIQGSLEPVNNQFAQPPEVGRRTRSVRIVLQEQRGNQKPRCSPFSGMAGPSLWTSKPIDKGLIHIRGSC